MWAGLGQLLQGIGNTAGNVYEAGGQAIGTIADRVAQEKYMNRAQNQLSDATDRSNQTYAELEGMYSPYTESGQKAMNQMWGEYNQMQGKTTPEFTVDMVNQWLDPSLDFQAKMAQRSLGAQQGGSGDYLSSSGMQQMMDQNRQIGETGWGNARDFSYQNYRDKLANEQNQTANRLNMLSQLNTQGSNATNALAGYKSQYGDQANQLQLTQGMMGAQQSALPAQMWGDLGGTWANMQSANNRTAGNMFGSGMLSGAGGAGGGVGGMLGGGNTGGTAQGYQNASFGNVSQNNPVMNEFQARNAGYNPAIGGNW